MTKKIKHVHQLDDNGCALACVAMIAGVTYRKARSVWLKHCNGQPAQIWHKGRGLRYTEMQDLAFLFGIVFVPNRTPTILLIHRKKMGHFVVVDQDGTILDPLHFK